jgi:oligoendopeptidase F
VIIPKLSRLLHHRDDRVRSSAEESLEAVLASHKASADAILVFLDYARFVGRSRVIYV